MDIDLTRLSQDHLNRLLIKAEKDLQTALLNGKSWQDLKELRDFIIEVRVSIHRNAFPHDVSGIALIKNKLHQQYKRIEGIEE